MILHFLALTCLVHLHFASSIQEKPTFSEKDDNTINVKLPNYPQVKTAVFVYVSMHNGVPETNTLTVHKNSAGQLTFDLKKDGRTFMSYVVRYLTNGDILLSTLTGAFPTAIAPPHHVVRRGTTVLDDNFSNLDLRKWHKQITCWGGGNGEFQMYTPESANTFVRNGELYLKPTFTADKFGENFLHRGTLDVKQQWGACTSNNEGGCHRQGSQIPPIMSSKLVSEASIHHGRVEVVAKIPKGDWLWPAIWLLPPGWPWKYGGWPASGEIDIMEARGNLDLKDPQGNPQGANVVYSTIHWGPTPGQHRQAGHWRRKSGGGSWADGFHTYTLDWNSDHIRMDIDNQPVFAWSTPSQGYFGYSHFGGHNVWSSGGHDAPFDGKMSLILNVAVGGGFFNDGWINTPHGKPWHGGSSNPMADFWRNRHMWEPTWHGDDVAMRIKSVKMIQY